MLPLKNRLKKKKDFENLFKKGKGCSQGFLYIKILKNGLDDSRFGFIVSKKFSPKAVLRNKIKRYLREAVKKNLGNVKKGFDAAIVVSSNAQLENTDVESEIKKLLKKSRLTN